jgi:hypothetical protein
LRLADTSRKLGASRKRPRIRKFLQFKKQKFLILARPLSRLQQAKNFSERREAKLLTRNASKPLGRAWCGHARSTIYACCRQNLVRANFAALPKERTKKSHNFQGAENEFLLNI